jgi:hypothetical protein
MKPVFTEAGLIWGRDAIYLDRENYINENTLILEGDLNRDLCSEFSNKSLIKFIPYKISFSNVLYYENIPEDLYDGNIESSFDIVENENIIAELKNQDKKSYFSKITKNHKMYFFRTYDEIFQIIATDFELEIYKKIMSPIITEAGLLKYPDAIKIDNNYFIIENTLKLQGTLNKNLCSGFKNIENLPQNINFFITFNNVIYLKDFPRDKYKKKTASSFDRVENEKIFDELFDLDKTVYSLKIEKEHKLYILETYYKAFEIIATDGFFELNK